MSGIFGRKKAPAPAPVATPTEEVIDRQEEKAEAKEKTEMQGLQKRRRLRRTGGMRLLFSPLRQEGAAIDQIKKKLGG
tara:strand:+ start:1141 stop:1374 length:234 start_codon:yes stop_codon:yes gene_type:complete